MHSEALRQKLDTTTIFLYRTPGSFSGCVGESDSMGISFPVNSNQAPPQHTPAAPPGSRRRRRRRRRTTVDEGMRPVGEATSHRKKRL